MSGQEELVNQFKEITNILDTEVARSILESTNWNLEIALATFLEDNSDTEVIPDPQEAETEPAVQPDIEMNPSGSSSSSKKDKKPSGAKPKIATLGSLNDAESSSDEEQGQAFYAGGSERSGQQVLGPPRKNPMKDYVSEVFRSAQQIGGQSSADEGAPRTVSSRLYGGTGFRLGQTDSDHVVIPGQSASGSSAGGERQSELVVLKLYRQGFSINDGDLRPYEDPASKEFMECIMKGEIPQELRKQNMNMIHLDLEDHRHEEYVKPKKRFSAFGGEGHTLGSPVPGTVEATSPTSAPTSVEDQKTNEQEAQASMNVDDAQPTTMLQIRLSDGSRLTGRFNHTHTVNSVRDYITRARPQLAAQEFMLLGSFPPKELTNGEATLKDAGLLNATILHRSK
ncbi:NSFL1 cofactor p47 [Culicoides brevitarsis]|uniref:NSFL1 cofactor p47 n=1 Tax=Culicoides brevitarsis TaxID=469753 RepID=UPI00307C713F